MTLTIVIDEPKGVGMTKSLDSFALNNTPVPRF